ncbi:inositol 1,3,4-trisphosphate 5/6-kinase 4 isoform X2 [Mangifera indica]|uniref:inositol 1,3,4-trisphosphate 5/6-kinase 4 isoform X2 n=1 Tax=Mangifera indica TaxID=29780 RepID=UPI001CFB4CB5|nr:inositol 1,3,4-trisphosphate 5/6-kinase 4 isoform X2 [Mangifera indica]
MSSVRGVIFDESLLLLSAAPNENDASFQLLSGASCLLRKLHHSKIRTGVSYGLGLSSDKVIALKRIATEYLCDCFLLDASVDGAANEINQAWGDKGGSILYVVSEKKDAFHKPSSHWMIIVVGVESASVSDNSSILYINRLEELPMAICQLNKKATGNNALMVGYVMKPSREEDFSKRGAFPMNPTPNGLIFVPLTFEMPLSSQLQGVDIVLHKATDEIKSINLGSNSDFSNRITFTSRMQELQRLMEDHSNFFVIDPLDNIYPVLDRLKIQLVLRGLQDLNAEGGHTIRGPHFLKVNDFNESDLAQRLPEAKLSFPCIVKPQVACGVADAHSMEYINHSSTLFKFYVLGETVFHAIKKSIPNSSTLRKSYERNSLKPISFDSLKSLPTNTESPHPGDAVSCKVDLDLELVKDAAKWLARTLDLTIFGFDVVVQEGTGDHVIVDVNYLPSFKEVDNDIAIPAFWVAIKMKYELRASTS